MQSEWGSRHANAGVHAIGGHTSVHQSAHVFMHVTTSLASPK